MNQVGTAGRSEGLIYNFDGMMFGDTEDAHTLLVAARKAGIADAVEERFYHGSITEGRSLFDRQQLVAMAVEAGMPKADAEAARKMMIFAPPFPTMKRMHSLLASAVFRFCDERKICHQRGSGSR